MKNKRAEVHLIELVQTKKPSPLGATKYAKAMTTQCLLNKEGKAQIKKLPWDVMDIFYNDIIYTIFTHYFYSTRGE